MASHVYGPCKSKVSNRGIPSDAFLDKLVEWGRKADSNIFAPNDVPIEIFTLIKPQLGPPSKDGKPVPWLDLEDRTAALLEAMRVHGMFESSGNFEEGVDVTNHTSMTHITGQETGVFQVSYDSIYLGGPTHPMKAFLAKQGMSVDGSRNAIQAFIDRMKADHNFALEYYARLVRVNIKWAGPLKRREINEWLKPAAKEEFKTLLRAA